MSYSKDIWENCQTEVSGPVVNDDGVSDQWSHWEREFSFQNLDTAEAFSGIGKVAAHEKPSKKNDVLGNSWMDPLPGRGISSSTQQRPSWSYSDYYPQTSTRRVSLQSLDENTEIAAIALDNGLNLLRNQIIASAQLHSEYCNARSYFGNAKTCEQVTQRLNMLLEDRRVIRLLEFLKNNNDDLRFQSRNFSMISSKNSRVDLISVAKHSNLRFERNDLVVIEGDRGKDLVTIVEPVISQNVAILFNYLKKKLHLKSLKCGQQRIPSVQPDSTVIPKKPTVINEDENFVTLPNKQVLRFVKPSEIQLLVEKFNDEVAAHKLCLRYVASLKLDIQVKNVEFQFDRKKLIIYYFSERRLDFRGLIKELFKVYKTRIWLCAILPIETDHRGIAKNIVKDEIPKELTCKEGFKTLAPMDFHGRIFNNLISMFEMELDGRIN
ncbi:BA75_01198T0 [Komagataella pastoris]|uniref:BA75_01198T0 n=1 Tax=Komagataella pastoris TaxID=4922 RepID=A0A1B2J6V9_PICPA|nr:BA75_01198T0 [Komagataella pastoris]